jgi:hypothetical protein
MFPIPELRVGWHAVRTRQDGGWAEVLKIDTGRLKDLVRERCGGVPGLMCAWHERFGFEPDRATFYEWLGRERFPSTLANLLRLCACVNVDPACVIKIESTGSYKIADAMLRKALGDVGGRGVRARDVVEIFGPIAAWPASQPIKEAFGRDWTRHEFENPGGNAFYQLLRIRFPDALRPRVLHFAYRVRGTDLWRVYGFVECGSAAARLVNFFGRGQQAEDAFSSSISVETHFGEGASSFRVASLHPFTLTLETRAESETKALRFEA